MNQSSPLSISTSIEQPALRFAKLLNVLPKITVLARDLIEHIRMIQTFDTAARSSSSSSRIIATTDGVGVESLFFQLFGDIFQQRESGAGQEQLSLTSEARIVQGNDKHKNIKDESPMNSARPRSPPSASHVGRGNQYQETFGERPELWSRSSFHQL